MGLPPPYYYFYSPDQYNYYNYLAPVHRRAISPSTQYPLPAPAPSTLPHIQPPQDIPDIRLGQVDPKEIGIYQRIAQLDPERGPPPAVSVRPLATSSPPGKRRKRDEDERMAAAGARVGQEFMAQRLPVYAGSDVTSSRVKPRLPTPPVAAMLSRAGPQQPYLGGAKKRGGGAASRLRESNLQTLRELSEVETASSSNAGVEEHGEDGRRSRLLARESDLVSVVSEGLDAEVTAITSSSSSPSSPEGSGATNTLQLQRTHNNTTSSSSGIATRSSRNTTAGSSSFSSSSISGPQNQTLLSSSSGSFQHPFLSAASPTTTSKAVKRMDDDSEYDSDLMPTYENWPPRPYFQAYSGSSPQTAADLSNIGKIADVSPVTASQYVGYHFLEQPPQLTSGVPPLTVHQYQPAGRYHARVIRAGSAGAGSSNSSLETPSPTSGGRPQSRPNSSQSAPLDRSVDRHYEWDTATPPATFTEKGQQHLAALPPEWAAVVERRRRSPAYNPRRDRDIGPMVQMANRDRVFSDSEIYSNVFPRRGARLALDVEARVRAMKREFQEFRQAQRQQWPLPAAAAPGVAVVASAPSPPVKVAESSSTTAGALDRLESLI